MSKPLRAFIVENSEEETALLLRELERFAYSVTHERVDSADAMTAALDRQTWDVVLADSSLPGFSCLSALTILREKGADLPFIVISGPVGEEYAVGAMKAGAHDLILKSNLRRLAGAVEREMRQARIRRERKLVQDDHDRLLAREQSARDQAEAVVQAKDKFLADLSHELLTPLTPVLAAAALAIAASSCFDLLISDIGFPDRSGWELMRQLQAHAPVRGIALSGFGSEEDARKSSESGFAAHLTKPVNAQKLQDLIHQMVL